MHARRGISLAVAVAIAVVARPAGAQPDRARARGGSLSEELRARAIAGDSVLVPGELWSWTTRAQGDALARGSPLLWASGEGGAVRAPYQRALEALAEGAGEEAELAARLARDPCCSARRYAWTTPYATAVPLGQRSYGPVLVRIELRPDALVARLAPDERPAIRVADAGGRPVSIAVALAQPERVGAVLHVRARAAPHPFREVVVHGQVGAFELGTPAVLARLREDRRVIERLRGWCARGGRCMRRAMSAAWSAPLGAATEPGALFAATMAFDTPRHRLAEEPLRAIARALARARSPRPVRR